MAIKVWHGSGTNFNTIDLSKGRMADNDYYGGGNGKGFYVTTEQKIAIGYALAARNAASPTLYEMSYTPSGRVFDVDEKYSGPALQRFLPKSRSLLEEFCRHAGLFKGLTDRTDALLIEGRIEEGKMELSGDQIFKGLSEGQRTQGRAADILKSHGYVGLRYNGGRITGSAPHDVYISYKPSDLKILKKYSVKKPSLASSK